MAGIAQGDEVSDSSQGTCRRCNAQVYWFKSFKTGKTYCCDTDDRRNFHKCEAPASKGPFGPIDGRLNPTPITPSYFEPSLEQRVESLEKQVAALVRTVKAVESRQPITGSDIPF
jgi:hypothetical protein